MKKLVLTSFLSFTCLLLMAQGSNLVLFTVQGEKFTLYVNGARINGAPESNVKATGISADFVKIRVVFQENGQEITKGVMVYDDTTPPPVEVTYQIKPNKKGSYGIQHVSTTNLESPSLTTTTPVRTVETTSTPVVTTSVTTTEVKSVPVVNSNMTTTASTGDNASMNISVNEGGNNVNLSLNMNVTGVQATQTQAQTTSVQTTTTSTTSTTSATSSSDVTSSTCAAMNQNDFQQLVASIDDQASEQNRLSIAKQAVDDSCLSTKQVANILGLFASEDNRLDFAKYAYLRTSDKEKYFNVNSSLYSQESVRELSEYIKSTR